MATVASDLSSAKPENIGSVCPTSTSFRAGVRHTVLMRTRVRARKELASASKGFHEARSPHHALPPPRNLDLPPRVRAPSLPACPSSSACIQSYQCVSPCVVCPFVFCLIPQEGEQLMLLERAMVDDKLRLRTSRGWISAIRVKDGSPFLELTPPPTPYRNLNLHSGDTRRTNEDGGHEHSVESGISTARLKPLPRFPSHRTVHTVQSKRTDFPRLFQKTIIIVIFDDIV